MAHDTEKYLHFEVGLLKESFAMEALWQDALKYHMIDQPGKLIALRLTEYYEMKAQGGSLPVNVSLNGSSHHNGVKREGVASENASHSNGTSSFTAQSATENILTASPEADKNAEEAADYWNVL